ncbi:MAG: Type 1 glutamine amidotransferase-like domain-containing protein [Bacteroidales bacterium]|nr:Type 1 glutamine amidotransferase-like domain-containing protein [Bacteroidales bacterium]
MKTAAQFIILFIISTLFAACSSGGGKPAENEDLSNQTFLIGNGRLSGETVGGMIEKSGIKAGGYVVIIPASFKKNDADASFLRKEFYRQNILAVHILSLRPGTPLTKSEQVAIENAGIICILNGKKNQFMKLANNTALKSSLMKARENGALIAGTGNGASVLGEYYFYQHDDPKPQSRKTVLKPGLGLLKNTVVDSFGFYDDNKNTIRKSSAKKNFVFIGLGDRAAVWLGDKEAVVLSKSGMTFVAPGKPARWLKAGDEFSLFPR